MTRRTCIACGRLTTGSYCVKHAAEGERKRQARQPYRSGYQRAAYRRITVGEIHARDQGICQLCKEPVPLAEATKDHITPLSQGADPDDAGNIRLAHRHCNSARGGKR